MYRQISLSQANVFGSFDNCKLPDVAPVASRQRNTSQNISASQTAPSCLPFKRILSEQLLC